MSNLYERISAIKAEFYQLCVRWHICQQVAEITRSPLTVDELQSFMCDLIALNFLVDECMEA